MNKIYGALFVDKNKNFDSFRALFVNNHLIVVMYLTSINRLKKTFRT